MLFRSVGLAVGRVGEAVQALAGAHVGAVGDDGQLVVGRQVAQHDARVDVGLGCWMMALTCTVISLLQKILKKSLLVTYLCMLAENLTSG